MFAAKTSKNNRLPYGFVNKLIEQTKDDEPWLNRNILNFAYKKFCTSMSLVVTTDTASKATGGRPKGSNNMTKCRTSGMVG